MGQRYEANKRRLTSCISAKWVQIIQDEVVSVSSSIRGVDVDEFLMMEYMGCRFSVVPFLLNGFTFATNEEMDDACDLGLRLIEKYDVTCMLNTSLADLRKLLGDECFEIAASLPASPSTTTKTLAAYMYHDKVAFAQYMLECFLLESLWVVLGKTSVDYSKLSTNMEAFSYYIGILWGLSKCSRSRMILSQHFKKINIHGLMKECMPEDCIIMRWLRGEVGYHDVYLEASGQIEEKQFTSDYYYELLSSSGAILSKEEYLALDENVRISMENMTTLHRIERFGFNIESFSSIIAVIFLCQGNYKSIVSELDFLKRELGSVGERESKREELVSTLSSSCRQLEKENKEYISRNKYLASRVSDFESDKVLTELTSRVYELERELADAKAELSTLEDSRLKIMRERSSQKKEIKQLTARLNELGCDSDEISQILCEEVAEVPMEEVLLYLKDKSIVLSACLDGVDFASLLCQRGLSRVRQLDLRYTASKVGSFDCIVILAAYSRHAVTIPLLDLARSSGKPWMFYNGTNLDNLCRQIYKELKSQDSVEA